MENKLMISKMKEVAAEMNTAGVDIMEMTFPGTAIKLFLVRDGTEAAKQKNEEKGSLLGVSEKIGDDTFFVCR